MTPNEEGGFSSNVLPQLTDQKSKKYNPHNQSIGSLKLEDLDELFQESQLQNSERDDENRSFFDSNIGLDALRRKRSNDELQEEEDLIALQEEKLQKLEYTEADLQRKLEMSRMEKNVKKTQLELYEVGQVSELGKIRRSLSGAVGTEWDELDFKNGTGGLVKHREYWNEVLVAETREARRGGSAVAELICARSLYGLDLVLQQLEN